MKKACRARGRRGTLPWGKLVGALCCLLCLGTAASLVLDGLTLHRANPEDNGEIAANVAALAQQEAAPLPELHPAPKPPEQQKPVPQNPQEPEQQEPQPPQEPEEIRGEGEEPSAPSLEEQQEKILAMNSRDVDKGTLLHRYAHAAVVGDSIVEAASAYQYLNDAILFGKIGASLVTADELFDAVIAAVPQTVFLGFGLNDIERYESHADRFVGHYRERLAQLREALPQAELYVLALLPVEDTVTNPVYQYIPDYNQALEELCQEAGAKFVDASFLLKARPELYDADGIHPKGSFYALWFTYLADLAGLSDGSGE